MVKMSHTHVEFLLSVLHCKRTRSLTSGGIYMRARVLSFVQHKEDVHVAATGNRRLSFALRLRKKASRLFSSHPGSSSPLSRFVFPRVAQSTSAVANRRPQSLIVHTPFACRVPHRRCMLSTYRSAEIIWIWTREKSGEHYTNRSRKISPIPFFTSIIHHKHTIVCTERKRVFRNYRH